MSGEAWRTALVGTLGGGTMSAILRTVRFTTEGNEHYQAEWDSGRPVVFILWHGRLVPLSWYHRSWKLVTLISPSRDGEYITRVVSRWGYDVVRGSSSREGGAGLRGLVRALRAGRSIAVTPDGPKGPRERVKPGVLMAAQLSGRAILPVGAAANRAWWFEGWDRFLIPQPFSRIHIVYGAPITVPRGAGEAELSDYTRQVEASMAAITAQAEAHVRG